MVHGRTKAVTKADYEKLLGRIQDKMPKDKSETNRFELPIVDITWEGQRTYFRNFADFPKALRRDPEKILQYLSKEFATPTESAGDKAIFVGKRMPPLFPQCAHRSSFC